MRLALTFSTTRRVVACAMLVANTLAACGGGDDAGPLPPNLVLRAIDLGALPHPMSITGRDGAYSMRFDGGAVWGFSDTLLARPDAQGRTLIGNSTAFTADLDAADGIGGFVDRVDTTGAPAPLLADTPAEAAYNRAHGVLCTAAPCGARYTQWVGAMVPDTAGRRALIFYSLIHALPGDYNFERLGTSVATLTQRDQLPLRPTLGLSAEYPDLLFGASEPPFGSTAVNVGDTLYVYGCRAEGLVKPCRLGRVAFDDVHHRAAWRYYAGPGTWTTRVEEAASVMTGNDIMSVSWNAWSGRYVAVYARPLTTSVVVRTAPHPEGPWSDEELAFVGQAPVTGPHLYDAQAHPAYQADGGRVMYVTYSRTTTGPMASEIRLVKLELKTPDGR